MRILSIITIYLFSACFFLNDTVAQNLKVYASSIDSKVQGNALDTQDYQIVEDGVGIFDNGKWVAIKLEVPNELAYKENFIHLAYSLIDTLEVWTYNSQMQLERVYQTGQTFGFNSRPYASPDFVFPMNDGVSEYYFRVYSSKPIILPFEILTTPSLFEKLTRKDFLIGAYTGIIMVMFLYNLVLLIITRDKSYAFYITYLFTLALTQTALYGYTDRYLFPDWPALNNKFAVLSGAVIGITSVLFIINFLQLKRKAPLFYKLILSLITFDIIGIIFLVVDWDVLAFHWVNFTSLVISILGIVVAIKLTRQKFKPAKFFLIAWSVFLFSVIIFALMNAGVLPYDQYLYKSMLYGSSIEAILLSVALADRINVLRREKEESRRDALALAKENERIIRQQNIILEQKVELRTEELRGSNAALKSTLKNLKAAQTQLVQSEKMASLGILTAGVAHEINNPLNYIYGGYAAINEELKKDEELNRDNLKEYVEWIETGAEKANEIVKSLNIYSRSNDDRMEDCNLNTIVEGCLSMVQNKVRGEIEVQKDLSFDIGTVRGNSGKLHQMVLNLLMNAIDAVSKNGLIVITTQATRKKSILTIEDNGSGIRTQDLKKILDPFFTTKPPGKGTGLGLSIAHSIIEEHGGKINFESEFGKGTIVTVELPKSKAHG